jgi:hypothetical protein
MRHAAALLALLPAAAFADEVHLRSGGRLTGVVVEQTADVVVLEAEPGRITLPAAHVVRVVARPSSLSAYRERAARLAHDDVAGWLELGYWARERDLLTLARQAFEHVLRIDPGSAEAHQAVGHVQLGGDWLTADESYRARGFVSFEGAWVRPEEQQAVLQERIAAADAERARAEADARIREAEARARAAEAEARRLEAEAQAAENVQGGFPYDYVFAGAGPIGYYPPAVAYPPFVKGAGIPGCQRPPRHVGRSLGPVPVTPVVTPIPPLTPRAPVAGMRMPTVADRSTRR